MSRPTGLRARFAVATAAVVLAAFSCRPVVYAPVSQPTPPAGDATPTRDKVSTVPLRDSAAPPAVRLSAADLVPPPISREFRGVWVASVGNIDWPSRRDLSTAQAQAELISILDRAVQLRLNAVIFQVRPAADALYASTIEPWSEYLTGEQGRAPNPYWDPLEFAVQQAHLRGLELHAWFNPYRARFSDAKSPLARNHIARTSPSLVKTYGPYLWMDPGEERIRQRTLSVILDVVKRYDIDGVHIDDYFYPYQERDRRGRLIDFPDNASWLRYQRSGGTLSRADWRRENVNTLVRELYEGIHRAKPWVKFGISPFGIWRPGFPAQITGLDAYTSLYADSRRWLREGWLDYFTPQLYWPTTRVAQSYSALLDWWSGENLHNRHLWPGNYTSRAGGTGSSSWPVGELIEQIRITRLQPGATGNVHFSMNPLMQNQAGLVDTLLERAYTNVALVPPSPWLSVAPPPRPQIELITGSGSQAVRLSSTGGAPWQWVVRARVDTGWITQVVPGIVRSWTVPAGARAALIDVTTVNRAGIAGESAAVTMLPASTNGTSMGNQLQ